MLKKKSKVIFKKVKKAVPEKVKKIAPEKVPRKLKFKKVVEPKPKDKYLFIITFKNGEQHRVRQPISEGRPIHFVAKIMIKGSIDGKVFYPPSMVKKIQWDEV